MNKIIIIGKENVGKSSLFNYITKKNFALVANIFGLTKDSQNLNIKIQDKYLNIIDTYGIKNLKELINLIDNYKLNNNIFLYIIDITNKINLDIKNIKYLIFLKKKFYIILNKIDLINNIELLNIKNFFKLNNLNNILYISITKNINIDILLKKLYNYLTDKLENEKKKIINIIGKQNSGKSTLMNRLIKQNIVKIDKNPGTTIDSIKYDYNNFFYIYDNPGIKKNTDKILDFCIFSKTYETIKISFINLLIIDYYQGICKNDIKIIKFVLNLGKKLIIIINKTEKNNNQKNKILIKEINIRYPFLNFIHKICISAKFGIGINKIHNFINDNKNNKHFNFLKKIKLNIINDEYLKNLNIISIKIIQLNPLIFKINIKNKNQLNNFKIKYIIKKISTLLQLKNELINIKFN